MNELVVRKPAQSSVRVVEDSIPVLDTARFEHMQRVATAMAYCSLIPDSLRADPAKVGPHDMPLADRMALTDRMTAANCFLIVNQAVRWNMDPFAVAQCTSVIKGRICHEGKLIAAMIEDKLGIPLDYTWTGDGEKMSVKVSGKFTDGRGVREIEGTVADWKTTRDGSPWVPKQYRKMLGYRGAREWCRLWAPGLLLGVYSSDELDELDDRRERLAGVTTAQLEPPDPDASKVIDAAIQATSNVEVVDQATGEITISKTPGQDAIVKALAEADVDRPKVTLEDTAPKTTDQSAKAKPAPAKPAAKDPQDIPDVLKRFTVAQEGEWLSLLRVVCQETTDSQSLLDLQSKNMTPAQQRKTSISAWAEGVKIFRERMQYLIDHPPTPVFDPEKWLKGDLAGALSAAEDPESLAKVKDGMLIPEKEKLTPAQWKTAVAMYRARLDEVDPANILAGG